MMMLETQTPEKIHFAIEKKLARGATYIDALIEYAHDHDLEIETVAEIVKKSAIIKEKIRDEASSRRMLKANDSASIKFFD
jgi:hypothetical protein